MLSSHIRFKNFSNKSKYLYVSKIFKDLKKNYFKNKIKILDTLSQNYKYSYSKKIINKYKNFKYFKIIGMGGSILGSKAIYQFLKFKIKKKFFFVDNLENTLNFDKKKKIVNLIISKSGNTLETILN